MSQVPVVAGRTGIWNGMVTPPPVTFPTAINTPLTTWKAVTVSVQVLADSPAIVHGIGDEMPPGDTCCTWYSGAAAPTVEVANPTAPTDVAVARARPTTSYFDLKK